MDAFFQEEDDIGNLNHRNFPILSGLTRMIEIFHKISIRNLPYFSSGLLTHFFSKTTYKKQQYFVLLELSLTIQGEKKVTFRRFITGSSVCQELQDQVCTMMVQFSSDATNTNHFHVRPPASLQVFTYCVL